MNKWWFCFQCGIAGPESKMTRVRGNGYSLQILCRKCHPPNTFKKHMKARADHKVLLGG